MGYHAYVHGQKAYNGVAILSKKPLKDVFTNIMPEDTAARYIEGIMPDGTVIAYARQEGRGHRIFVQDMVTGQERQLTFGPGSDEQPAFAPDGYFIAFMSTRSGQRAIYITTRNGGQPRRMPTGSGDAAFPAWNPARM